MHVDFFCASLEHFTSLGRTLALAEGNCGCPNKNVLTVLCKIFYYISIICFKNSYNGHLS